MAPFRVAVTDDWQDVSKECADWSTLQARAEVEWFHEPFADEAAAVQALAAFDAVVPMRDRTKLTASLLQRLPRLKLIAQTGPLALHIDLPTCLHQGIVCCGSPATGVSAAATPELTLGLMLSAAHRIADGFMNMRQGRWQQGIPFGEPLAGRTLGLIGLGNIGKRMAGYGAALGMKVLAWSPNLTATRAAEAGATLVAKGELLAQSDVVSMHLVHSEKTVGTLQAADLALMKPGALLVNTARGPLVDEAALLAALQAGRIGAALDVYDREPLPADHPFRTLPNVVLTPHLGFVKRDTFSAFYQQSVDNVIAFLDGHPRRVMNPDVLRQQKSHALQETA
jgi:phosphoglycerate dehydrogenase-like enzyme